MDESERAVRCAIDGELRLLDPEVRASPALVLALLDPEFAEIGSSGRRWDAESVLTVTSGKALAAGIVHLTYFVGSQGRRAWRSSLWRLTDAGWRMYFRQGTPAR